MTPRLTGVGTCTTSASSIFTPTNARMTPRPRSEVPEPVGHPGEAEVQRAQPEDRERVRREHDERLVGDARIAGMESTANTTSLVSTSTSTANSGVASSAPLRRVKSFWPSYSSVDGTRRRTSAEHGVAFRVHRRPGVAGDLHRGHEQERAEDVEDPVEALEQRDAGEDEHGPQHEGTEDAPEQHAELVAVGHADVAEDHRPDEDVVDREALLDQVAGQVLTRGGAAGDHAEHAPRTRVRARSTRPDSIAGAAER